MSVHARTAPRKFVAVPCWISRDNGVLLECALQDVSKGGLSLTSDHCHLIPDQFLLFLTKNDAVRRYRQTVWKHDGTLGAYFLNPKY